MIGSKRCGDGGPMAESCRTGRRSWRNQGGPAPHPWLITALVMLSSGHDTRRIRATQAAAGGGAACRSLPPEGRAVMAGGRAVMAETSVVTPEGSAVMPGRIVALQGGVAVPQTAAAETPAGPAVAQIRTAARQGRRAATPVATAGTPAETAAARSLPAAMSGRSGKAADHTAAAAPGSSPPPEPAASISLERAAGCETIAVSAKKLLRATQSDPKNTVPLHMP